MPHPNEDRFRAGYEAFQAGNMDALRDEFLAPDVVWHTLRTQPFVGYHNGVDDVRIEDNHAHVVHMRDGSRRIVDPSVGSEQGGRAPQLIVSESIEPSPRRGWPGLRGRRCAVR